MAGPDTSAELAAQRELIALACRVLAHRDLAPGYLGHVSMRVDTDRLLVRCRGPQERGLAFTDPGDIRLVDLDGRPGLPGELDGGWAAPNELPIHAEVLRADRDVDAVVHAHPEQVVVADLAGIPIRPIFGSFDMYGAQLAEAGVPVYPRSVLIRTPELGREMVEAMAGRPVVILRGHGITAVGTSVPEAVLRAVSVATVARVSRAVVAAGGTLVDIPAVDFALLPDLGPRFTNELAWRHEVATLEAAASKGR
jgi:3,4-dihydroxyphthalate decarboxylase